MERGPDLIEREAGSVSEALSREPAETEKEADPEHQGGGRGRPPNYGVIVSIPALRLRLP